jgi:regulator of protease activity HflC (stomatin/prohibitin superfamily)
MSRLTILGVVAGALIFFAVNTLFVVDQAQQALVVQFGDPVRVIKEPGLSFKLPLFQNVYFFNKRALILPGESGVIITQDRKNIIVSAFARYRISDPLQFYKAVQGTEDMARARLTPILNASLRRVPSRSASRSSMCGSRDPTCRSRTCRRCSSACGQNASALPKARAPRVTRRRRSCAVRLTRKQP